MKRLAIAFLMLVGLLLPAGAQTLTSSLSSLPLFLQPNAQTDYAVAVVQVNTGGVISYVVRRIPLSNFVGPPGASAYLAGVNVTTLPPGSQATGFLTGATPNYTLNLGLPSGLQGPAGNGNGTVTSVAVAVPADESVSGSPVTSSGTITISRNSQSANTVFAGPSSGSAAAPSYRGLVVADLPNSVALLASPAFTGTPTVPTATAGTNTTQAASTAFVLGQGYTTSSQAAAAAPVQSVAGRQGAVTLAVADVSGAAKSGANTDITSLASPALGSPTMTTQAAADNSTKGASTAYADRAASTAAASAGGGAPSAYTTQALPYSFAASDKGNAINPTGTGALNLPAATAVSGWYVFVKKRDDGGAATLTPASGTIDGLASVVVYKEECLVWYDAAASASAGSPVYRTQGRQRGWVDFGSFSVTSGTASVSLTAGAGDAEIRDIEIDYFHLMFSTSATVTMSILQAGSAGTVYGETFGGSNTTYTVNTISGNSVPVGNPGTVATTINTKGRIVVENMQSPTAYGIGFNYQNATTLPTGNTGIGGLSTAGAVSSLSLAPTSGTFSSMLYNVRLYRP